MKTWVILGATSAIARAFIRQEADTGAGFLLCGRDQNDMLVTAADARHRGAAAAEVCAIDMRDADSFAPVLARLQTISGTICCAVFVGSMPEQSEIDADPGLIPGVVIDSFTGPAQFLTALAPLMEEREAGEIVGVSSVAGDRGRLGNYVYGAAKAGFSTYLSGLRNRLGRKGIHVMTVKPGPVDTAMTWGSQLPFMATPDAVAKDIIAGLKSQRNTVYTKRLWLLVMTIIRLIPEPIFKKLSI